MLIFEFRASGPQSIRAVLVCALFSEHVCEERKKERKKDDRQMG